MQADPRELFALLQRRPALVLLGAVAVVVVLLLVRARLDQSGLAGTWSGILDPEGTVQLELHGSGDTLRGTFGPADYPTAQEATARVNGSTVTVTIGQGARAAIWTCTLEGGSTLSCADVSGDILLLTQQGAMPH